MDDPQRKDPTEPIPIVVLPPEGADIARPPRAVTLGRRRSDRWLAWAAIVLMFVLALFTAYTSYRLDRIEHDLDVRPVCLAPER